jgi:hypothetical protein
MARRFLQLILLAALICGAVAPALACGLNWQFSGHACCRNVVVKKTPQKMRAAPRSHQETKKPINCCESNPANPQQTPIAERSVKQEDAALANHHGDAESTLLERVALTPSRLPLPCEYSPPPFILYHSLLI